MKLVVALTAVTVIAPPDADAVTTELSGRPVTGSAVSVALTRAAMAAAVVAGVSPGRPVGQRQGVDGGGQHHPAGMVPDTVAVAVSANGPAAV